MKGMQDVSNRGQFHPLRNKDTHSIVGLLKACAKKKDLGKGFQLHAYILEHKLPEDDTFLTSALVSMYAKCGALTKAQQVLNELPVRNVVTWNALIAGYAQQGQGENALDCFDRMECEGHSPDNITFICALKACGSIGAVTKGEIIHEKIVNLGMLDNNSVLVNSLVDMYARCGALSKAQKLLDGFPLRDVVTWNTLIGGYTQQGQGEEALKCFESMQNEGYTPDAITLTLALKACGSTGAIGSGKRIHNKIVNLGLLKKDVMLGSVLVDMYARCGALAMAQELTDELLVRNVVTWNTLIAAYAQREEGEEALKCFDIMQCEGHFPDPVTFICALKACGSIGAADKGERIHDMMSLNLLKKDVVLATTLVDMYARCGALAKAQRVLEQLPVRNASMWTALISGYTQQEHAKEALKCFESMQREGHSPDAVAFICALKACGSIGAADRGERIHDKIVSLGMLKKNLVLGNTLIDMYAKCGELGKARQVVDGLPVRNVVTWNALIVGYAHRGHGEEALKCFDSMQSEGHTPDTITFIGVLKACGIAGAFVRGEQILEKIVNLSLLAKDIVLGNTLLDMFVKCGALVKAAEVLEELPVWNVITLNTMVAGYAQQGQPVEAIDCCRKMQSKGVGPDLTTLVCLLNACSHSGYSDEAKIYFSRMRTNLNITFNIEHYCCMVDLFSRAGEFNKALLVIEDTPFADYLPVWLALLSACRKWQDVKIGRFSFNHAIQLDKNDASAYICMFNIYTEAGMHEDADNIELMRVVNEAWKMPECCLWSDVAD